MTPERYTSVYVSDGCGTFRITLTHCHQVSPSSAHPRLNLRLTSPAEPGFFLQRVQVKSIKETWRVLEVRSLTLMLNAVSYPPPNPDREETMLAKRDPLWSCLDTRKLRLFLVEGTGSPQR